jgi:hypothetical protein
VFNCDEKDGPTVSGTSGLLTCIIVCSSLRFTLARLVRAAEKKERLDY